MALIVEDGTGLANANSYCASAAADSYHSDRGNATWAALTSGQKSEALIKATDYIEQVYFGRWQGDKKTTTQALAFPRSGVFVENQYLDNDAVPTALANACAVLAVKASADDLISDLTQTVVREKVDVIEVEYDKNSPQFKRYREVDLMLAPLCKGGHSDVFKTVVRT